MIKKKDSLRVALKWPIRQRAAVKSVRERQWRCRTDVGLGSTADCLSVNRRISVRTASVVSGEKCRKDIRQAKHNNYSTTAAVHCWS